MDARVNPITLSTLTPARTAAWDDYVRQHPDGSFFHLAGWQRVMEEGLGHRSHFLCALRGERIVGVYPMAEVRSLLFGHNLVALPFCVYGGILADDSDAQLALDKAAQQLAQQLNVDALEVRNRQPVHDDWPRKSLHVTFRKAITGDAETDLNAIPRKQRAMIRKAIGNGLDHSIDESLGDFLDCYDTSVRNLGTPVFPRKYFRVLRDVFGDACEVLTIRKDGAAVASVMSFYFREEVLPYYGGGGVLARQLAGNDMLYWALMKHAGERGARLFDYGRSKIDTGAYHFKKNWGFEPQPLAYEYFLVKAKAMPDVNPLNPKYRLFIETWKKLPLPVARLLGPLLSRHLG